MPPKRRPFSLLKLPSLPMELVYKNADLHALRNLFRCSTRSAHSITQFKIRKITNIEITFENKRTELSVDYNGSKFSWKIDIEELDKELSLFPNRHVENVVFKCNFHDLRHLNLHPIPRGTMVHVEKNYIFDAELAHIQGLMSPRALKVCSEIEALPRFTAPIVIIDSPNFYTFNPFTNSQHILIRRCHTIYLDFLSIFDDWKAGKMPNLVSFIVLECEITAAKLTRLGGAPWSPEKRAKNFVLQDGSVVDCSSGLDVENELGELGTVMTKEHSEFYFLVWKQRAPVEPEH